MKMLIDSKKERLLDYMQRRFVIFEFKRKLPKRNNMSLANKKG